MADLSLDGKSKRWIWKQEDSEVPDSTFNPLWLWLCPSLMRWLNTLLTNLYFAQVLGDPSKTRPEEIKDFLAILLFMGVLNFPSLEDYWQLRELSY